MELSIDFTHEIHIEKRFVELGFERKRTENYKQQLIENRYIHFKYITYLQKTKEICEYRKENRLVFLIIFIQHMESNACNSSSSDYQKILVKVGG